MLISSAHYLSISSQPSNQLVGVDVSPLAIFSVLDHYIRRETDSVVGTLLGQHLFDGKILVTGAFPVPQQGGGDEIALDQSFHKNLLDLHRRVNPKETVVGWYSTSTTINADSAVIHRFYEEQTPNTIVHLTVDPASMARHLVAGQVSDQVLSTAAYVRLPISLGDRVLGHQFQQVPLFVNTESLNVLLRNQSPEVAEESKSTEVVSDMATLGFSIKQVLALLEEVLAFVDKVLSGSVKPDPIIARKVVSLISSLPQIDPAQFEKMIGNSVQDLLMVIYLANLTKTQLVIAEQLEAFVS
jgi:translation initiation factor 3 subunit F